MKNFGEKGGWSYPASAQIFWVSLLSQEWVQLRTSNLAVTLTGPSEQKAIKNFREKGAWAYLGTA